MSRYFCVYHGVTQPLLISYVSPVALPVTFTIPQEETRKVDLPFVDKSMRVIAILSCTFSTFATTAETSNRSLQTQWLLTIQFWCMTSVGVTAWKREAKENNSNKARQGSWYPSFSITLNTDAEENCPAVHVRWTEGDFLVLCPLINTKTFGGAGKGWLKWGQQRHIGKCRKLVKLCLFFYVSLSIYISPYREGLVAC